MSPRLVSGTLTHRACSPSVAKAYAHAKKTLADNRDLVEDLTEALIEKETVDYRQLAEMIVKYHPEKKEALQKAAGSTSLGF